MIDINVIKALCINKTITLTKHAGDRIRERGIKYNDIKMAIMDGVIIEEYMDDKPNPRILILGKINKKPLHVVIGVGDWNIQIITAYYPSSDKWKNDNKTRR